VKIESNPSLFQGNKTMEHTEKIQEIYRN